MATKDKITQILKQKIDVQFLEVIDDSALHVGHSEAKGGGHFSVLIVSNDFKGKTQIQRHRLIYQILAEELKNTIHALSIKALTPTENI